MQDPTNFFSQQIMNENLANNYLKLKKSLEKEDLKSPEWKKLEAAYYQHLTWRFEYPEKTFGKQKVYSIVISIVVMILILSGLVFAFLQLRYAIQIGNFENLTTELSMDAAGKVSVKSSIIGAVVLVISLAFFYLYLKNVFRIHYPIPPLVSLDSEEINTVLKEKIKDIGKDQSDNT